MNKRTVILFFPLLDAKVLFSNLPWALLYLERMIRDLDVEIILIDERLHRDYSGILRDKSSSLLFAGISAMVGYQVVSGIRFAQTVKALSTAPVIWGGWFPTVFPEMLLRDGHADYICIGQGEIPFREFTLKMLENGDVSDIAGIGYKKDSSVIINPNAELADNRKFPRINLRLTDVNALIDLNGKVAYGYRGADYHASTGCPHNCSFCNLALVFGRKWYPKNIEEIIDDLRYLKNEARLSHISFCDDNFFVNRKYVHELSRALMEAGLNLTWEANTHAGSFLKTYSDEDIKLMYQAGCRRIKIGAESGDQQVLNLLNKNTSVSDNLRIVKVLKKHAIAVRYYTMIGFPPDADRDFILTMQLIGKAILINRKLEININTYKPIPKTPLYEVCVKYGFEYPQTVQKLTEFFGSRFRPPWYRRDYEKELEAFTGFYFLFLDPFYFTRFRMRYWPLLGLINLLLWPWLYFRFKTGFLQFRFEAYLFRRWLPAARTIGSNDSLVMHTKRTN